MSAVFVCCNERHDFLNPCPHKLTRSELHIENQVKNFTLSMLGTSSCSFLIRSLIRVLLTWFSKNEHIKHFYNHKCAAPSFHKGYVKKKMKLMPLKQNKQYPLSNASRVCGTAPLCSNLTRHRILELQEIFNDSHFCWCFWQAQVMRQRATSYIHILYDNKWCEKQYYR